jgi:hypothetical protein
MNDTSHKKEGEPPNKALKTLLFFANWLFLVFLSRRFISPPAGDLDFLAKNIGTFLVAVVLTGLMIRFSSRRAVILLIPTMVILALALAMS